MRTILVAEDNSSIREGISLALEEKGHRVFKASRGEEALRIAKEKDFDLLIADLRMPGLNGLELLKAVKEISPRTYVVVITAFGSVDTAVEAMKLGAYDYLQKPFPVEQVELLVERMEKEQRLAEESEYLKGEMKSHYKFNSLIGESSKMRKVYQTIVKVAQTRSVVLIRGESGTGKELVAGAIHYQSSRKDKPLIKVSCAALPETLLESELFGHEKGSFTGAHTRRRGRFELADGGSLFLDEIGEMSPSAQVKLLRVLQDGCFERVGGTESIKVDVRLITATNRDLEKAIREGRFREDLYYRLNVVPIYLPPLREGREDISLLAQHFLKHFSTEAGKSIKEIHPQAMAMLKGYSWPGNIRELENAIERAVVLGEGDTLLPQHLALGVASVGEEGKATVKELLGNFEKEKLLKALREANWVQSEAAHILGLPRSSLRYKMKKFNLDKRKEC